MPGRKEHEELTRRLLGRGYGEVHAVKDFPAKFLGPSHRQLFHDLQTNIMLGAMYGPGAFVAGMLHDSMDFYDTKTSKKNYAEAILRQMPKMRKRKVGQGQAKKALLELLRRVC